MHDVLSTPQKPAAQHRSATAYPGEVAPPTDHEPVVVGSESSPVFLAALHEPPEEPERVQDPAGAGQSALQQTQHRDQRPQLRLAAGREKVETCPPPEGEKSRQ